MSEALSTSANIGKTLWQRSLVLISPRVKGASLLPSLRFALQMSALRLLNIRATERKAGKPDVSTSVSVKISVDSVRSTTDRGETVSAKVATVTVYSSLPDTKPQKKAEPRYLVLNLASNRPIQHASQSEPQPTINWSGKAPDFEIRNMSWVSHLFGNTKEKVRSLAERTGLRFTNVLERIVIYIKSITT